MEISDDDEENCHLTENSIQLVSTGRGEHLVRILRNRELGRDQKELRNVRAQLDFKAMPLTFQSKQGKQFLSKRTFSGRYEGFMGITPDSHYLIALERSVRREMDLMLFTFTPREALLKRIITIPTPSGYLYHIKALVPLNGGTYFGAYSHDETDFRRLTTMENNLQVYLKLSPLNFDFQINLESVIVVVPRFIASTTPPRRSLKHYVMTHNSGVILITGVSIQNFMFSTDDKLKAEGDIDRSMWRISRREGVSWERAKKCSMKPLDPGESIGICACPDYYEESTPYDYFLHKNMEMKHIKTLPIFFYRDLFSIDARLSRTVEKYLRKTAQFQGSAIRSLQDYEVDVSDIYDSRAYLHAFALFELEVFVDATTTANEFHLFRVAFQWNLTKGAAYPTMDPQHIGKVDNRYVFANRWWPLKTPGAVATMDFHRHVNNSHILRGSKNYNLSTCDDQLQIPVQL